VRLGEVGVLHAQRLRLRLGLDRLAERQRVLALEHLLGHRVRERRAGREPGRPRGRELEGRRAVGDDVRQQVAQPATALGDLAAVMPGRPDGIVLPKCAGAADVNKLSLWLDAFEAASGIAQGSTRIVTVATETARAVLKLLDFEGASPRLWGMMWGAEDLAASLGASRNRTDGRYHGPFLLARDLCLISAAAAGLGRPWK